MKTAYSGFDYVPVDNRPVSRSIPDDLSVGLLVKYIGSSVSATVTVNASGDITFKHGAQGAEANDTTVGGASDAGATIDVSEATENTFGKVVDIINASANWRAVLIDTTRAATSTAGLLTKSATQAKVPKGIQLLIDTSGTDEMLLLVAPEPYIEDIRLYESPSVGVRANHPFKGFQAEVAYADFITDITGGTADAVFVNADGNAGDEKQFSIGPLVDDTLSTKDYSNYPLRGRRGGRLLIGLEGSNITDVTRVQFRGSFKRALS